MEEDSTTFPVGFNSTLGNIVALRLKGSSNPSERGGISGREKEENVKGEGFT